MGLSGALRTHGSDTLCDALLKDLPGRPRYLVVGPTHPRVLAAEGEAYRSARIEQARRLDVADSVKFDPGYYSGSMLTALIHQAAVVALPYDSDEQVSCGVLVDAIANGQTRRCVRISARRRASQQWCWRRRGPRRDRGAGVGAANHHPAALPCRHHGRRGAQPGTGIGVAGGGRRLCPAGPAPSRRTAVLSMSVLPAKTTVDGEGVGMTTPPRRPAALRPRCGSDRCGDPRPASCRRRRQAWGRRR